MLELPEKHAGAFCPFSVVIFEEEKKVFLNDPGLFFINETP
jgi:hypothetical protein